VVIGGWNSTVRLVPPREGVAEDETLNGDFERIRIITVPEELR